MRSALAALILGITALPALAQEAVWSDVREAEGIYAINFGVPETDDAPLFMSCTREGDAVEISWHADVGKPAGHEKRAGRNARAA